MVAISRRPEGAAGTLELEVPGTDRLEALTLGLARGTAALASAAADF